MAAVFNAGAIEAKLTLDNGQFLAKLESSKLAANAFKEWMAEPVDLNLNTEADALEIEGLRAELDAALGTFDTHVELSGETEALLQAGLLRDELEGVTGSIDITPEVHTGPALLKALAFGAILRTLLTGGGGPGLFGMGGFTAGFGSILSFAGFGIEHLITTAIGLVGSLAGAFLGLGVLAAGAFGKLAVGMGSDMLVMRSTISDTRTLQTALNNVAQAAAVYGKNSLQYAAAQNQLTYTINSLGATAGVYAELNLAKALNALNAFWDQATSAARVAAVNFVMPWLGVARVYIPMIANAAKTNFGIMTTALQPLQSWIKGPGAAIFQDLEGMFAKQLPESMKAFTLGFELVVRAVDYAAHLENGGFMKWLVKVFTYLNSPAGFHKLEHGMRSVVGMFKVWAEFLKAIVVTIFDIFGSSKGLGTGIVKELTGMLNQLDKYLTSKGGSKAMGNLFQVHKNEVLAILKLIPALVIGFGRVYLALAPIFTGLATDILVPLIAIAGMVVSNPFGGWVVVILLILSKMGILQRVLKDLGVTKYLNSLITKFIQLGAQAVKSAIVTAIAWGRTFAAMLAEGAVWLFENLARVGIVVATSIFGAEATGAAWALSWIIATAGLALLVAAIVLGVAWIVTHWKQVVGFFKALWANIVAQAKADWSALSTAIIVAFKVVTTWFHDLPGTIVKLIGDASKILYNVGKEIINGLWDGLKAIWNKVTGWFSGLANVISHLKGPLDKDRKLLIPHGQAIMEGFAQGLTEGFNGPVKDALALATQVAGAAFGQASVSVATTGGAAAGAAAPASSLGDVVSAVKDLHSTVKQQQARRVLAMRTA